MANGVFEVVRTVMAIREYDERPLPDDFARRILEAARLTASASNRQPWHFVLVRDPERVRKLGTLIRTGRHTSGAAAAVIVAYEKEAGQYGMSDASRAIQSMIIVAWGGGVGSNWTGFGGMGGGGRGVGVPRAYDLLGGVPVRRSQRPRLWGRRGENSP